MTAKPHERPVALRTIEPDPPFGELCLCSVRTGVRGNTACALVESEAFEIKLTNFLGYLHQNRAALDALMFTLCLRLTDAEHRIEVMAHRGAEQRLGRLLLRLATSPDVGWFFSVPPRIYIHCPRCGSATALVACESFGTRSCFCPGCQYLWRTASTPPTVHK